MYRNLLVALENSALDTLALAHATELARHHRAHLSLIHVAHGHMARNQENLRLAASEEMRRGHAYLETCQNRLRAEGFEVSAHLSWGEPAKQIVGFAESNRCDLIVMATHGHKLLGDLFFGSVSRTVRHGTNVPVLLIRGGGKPASRSASVPSAN